MSLDGLFTHALVTELNTQLANGRINKVQQPYDNEIILTIRAQRKNYKLLLSAHPSFSRIQISDADYINPEIPPNFCMVLRKFVEGNRLTHITQYENDRIVILHLERKNEIGDSEQQQLAIEMMGRHSNILLLNNNREIIDCIKHIPVYQNSYRTLLPGAQYILPPQGEHLNPFTVNPSQLTLPAEDQFSPKWIQQKLMGFGRDSATELYTLTQETGDFASALTQFMSQFANVQPTLVTTAANKLAFLPFPYQTINGEQQQFSQLSDLLSAFFAKNAHQDHIKQVANQLIQVVDKELKRNRNKLLNLEADLEKSKHAEQYKLQGELLTTFLYEIEKGQSEVTLKNYYADDQPVTITLDPALTPSQNAQKYYQKYNKLTQSVKYIEQQKALTLAEIDYLESVEIQIQLAQPSELVEIKEELIQQRYIKPTGKGRKKQQKKLKPRKYQTTSGVTILVGRNNRQNDELTMKKANKSHYWFHTKDIPGSHVILETDQPNERDIEEAAKLAAKYSKYALSANVPVDYTQVKHVKKPNGAKPGFVNYFEQQTVFVTPAK